MVYESPLTISLKKTKAKIQKAIYNIVKGIKVARNSFVARAAWENLAILYPRKFCKIYISIKTLTVKICKIWHSGKERTEIVVLIGRKKSVRSKQNERENRIIGNFSESFLQNFLKIGSLVGFNAQNNFSKFEKNYRTNFTESRFF